MMRLWTAASGMTAQQTKIDTISNNLANVNTTGFKKSRRLSGSALSDGKIRRDTIHGWSPVHRNPGWAWRADGGYPAGVFPRYVPADG